MPLFSPSCRHAELVSAFLSSMVYGNYGRINASNTTSTDPQTNILQQYNNNYTYNSVNPQSNSFAPIGTNKNISFKYRINKIFIEQYIIKK